LQNCEIGSSGRLHKSGNIPVGGASETACFQLRACALKLTPVNDSSQAASEADIYAPSLTSVQDGGS